VGVVVVVVVVVSSSNLIYNHQPYLSRTHTHTKPNRPDERAIKKFFAQFGKVRSVVMLRDKATNRHKGA
jgi:hypothetical protein